MVRFLSSVIHYMPFSLLTCPKAPVLDHRHNVILTMGDILVKMIWSQEARKVLTSQAEGPGFGPSVATKPNMTAGAHNPSTGDTEDSLAESASSSLETDLLSENEIESD